jgi:hypothetical protein
MRAKSNNLLLLLVIVIGGIIIMEVGVRELAPQQLVRGYAEPDPDLGTYVAQHYSYRDPYTAEGAYQVRTNDFRFRMDEDVDLSPKRQRVLVYGDSFTFGWGLNYQDSYFATLKKVSETAHPQLQLLNAAVGGYASGHIFKLMKRHLPALKPSAMIYFFNNNDFTDNAITDVDYRVSNFSIKDDGQPVINDAQPFSSWKRFLLNRTPYAWLNRHSHLFVLTKGLLKRALNWKQRVEPINLNKVADAPASSLQPAFGLSLPSAYQNNPELARLVYITELHIRRIADLAAVAKVPLLIIWVPSPDEMFAPDKATPNQSLLALGRAMLTRLALETPGVRFINTTYLIPTASDWLTRKGSLRLSDGHFNAAGARWYGNLVQPSVMDFLTSLASNK